MTNTNSNNGAVKFVHYSGQKIPVPAELTIDQIKVGLSQMFPRLASDDVIHNEAPNGDITFYVPAGEKGSDEPSETAGSENAAVKFVHYSGQKIPVPAELTIDQIKVGLSQMFPRLASDDVIHNEAPNGDITFYVPAGEKGSDEPSETAGSAVKFVHYSGQKIPVPAELTIDQIKVGLSQMFPRLASDDVIHNEAPNGDITFYVPAGEKGSDEPSETASVKFVHYSGQKIPVPAELTIDQIKVGLSQMFPRLASDDVIHNEAPNGDITFYVPAGEKGSDEPSETAGSAVKFVHYSGQKIPVPAELTIDQIKVGLSQMFPRLASDDVIHNEAPNGDITFYVPAGEKGLN